MSDVVKEIVRQLHGQNVNLRGKTLIKMDKNTLRVSGRGINVDIKYNHGLDLYDVMVHKIDTKKLKVKTCKVKGIYFDNLPDYFKPDATKYMKCGRWARKLL